jgi:glycosyltransferase involved in cell wall biosynthesis
VVISVNVHLSGSTVGARRSYGAIVRRLVASAYPHADAIVAISPDIAADLAATAGVARNRIAVIGNPVDREGIERAAAAPVEHPWLQPGQPPVVLAVGKLKKQKDFPTLIRAFARVLHQRPARLIVLGEGEERARLQAMVTRMGLSDVVSMPGFVTNPYCWMARASVFVLSSAWEGLSNALLEALACGCPAVSTDCPSGPRNVLANGTFGPLVPVGDDTAMAEAILSLLAEPPAAERLRDRVRAFALDRSTERYLEVLEAASTRCRTAKAIRVAPGPELLEP